MLESIQDWQADNHQGFVKSYRSRLCHAPISKHEPDWGRIEQRLSVQQRLSQDNTQAKESGLDNGKVLIICGMTDPVIIFEELREDARTVLGVDDVQLKTCDTGHEIPITKSAEILEYIWNIWEGK